MFSEVRDARVAHRYHAALLTLVFALIASFSGIQTSAHAAPSDVPSFGSPSEAVGALIAAAKASDTGEILRILGPGAEEVASSGDPVADAATREGFVNAYEKANELKVDEQGRQILYIGTEYYPFPIPLVEENGAWRFDTRAGLEEILNRRIGKNELAAIEVLRAYVAAQSEYASVDRDGKGPQYARRIMSSDGKRDGLYWPDTDGQDPSPLGVLFARAQAEGYGGDKPASESSAPYHGYVYKILLRQGASAEGGARDYVINDRMIGGFAMVAAPVKYGNSGIMTFIVNQDGKVFERDLGEDTLRLVSQINAFDPDPSWRPTQTD